MPNVSQVIFRQHHPGAHNSYIVHVFHILHEILYSSISSIFTDFLSEIHAVFIDILFLDCVEYMHVPISIIQFSILSGQVNNENTLYQYSILILTTQMYLLSYMNPDTTRTITSKLHLDRTFIIDRI